MTKVSEADLKAFGLAVKRERSLRGWTLDKLGAKIDPPVGKSLVSKIEKGRKDTLNSRTVGRFIKALDLEQSWIDKFLGADTSEVGDETKAERDADRIFDRLTRESATEGASEDLLIRLANTYAEGTHRDIETAYVGVRNALVSYANMKAQSVVPGNADAQYQAVMAKVAELNDLDELERADALLGAEENRMLAAHQAEKERQDEARRQILKQRLNQDRLRNRPDDAAKRHIANLHRQAPPGGVRQATRELLQETKERGEREGDPFDLRVALELAEIQWKRAKGPKRPPALNDLGLCHLSLGEISSDNKHLRLSLKAFQGHLKIASKKSGPDSWAGVQNNLANSLRTLGEREENSSRLFAAVDAYKKALTIRNEKSKPEDWAATQSNLGYTLQTLGTLEKDTSRLLESVDAHKDALTIRKKEIVPADWASSQQNLGLALRWLGDVGKNLDHLTHAKFNFENALQVLTRDAAPFQWAQNQWNLADLTLARFALDPDPKHLQTARTYVLAAREIFAEGSEHQTQRCDNLLTQIDAAEANL